MVTARTDNGRQGCGLGGAIAAVHNGQFPTCCAARLETVDQGAPVSTYTVAREMGHGGEAWCAGSTGTLARCATVARPWSTAWSSTPLS